MILSYITLWYVQAGFAMGPPSVLPVFQNIKNIHSFEMNCEQDKARDGDPWQL
jgi:hypothetical protein